MKEQILKDINELNKRLKYETSENRIFSLYVSLLSMQKLLTTITDEPIDIKVDFNIPKIEEIYARKYLKRQKRYSEYVVSTIEPNIELAQSIREKLINNGYFIKPTKPSIKIDDKLSAEYLIDFMASMGNEVFNTCRRMYFEDRIAVASTGKFSGLCTQASVLNSTYITYMPNGTYHDAATIAHEMGHVIHDDLRFERGIGSLQDHVFIECLSTYLELLYHEYINRQTKYGQSLNELMLRNIKEYVTSFDIMDKLTREPLMVMYNSSFYPLTTNFSEVSILFDEDIDQKYYQKVLTGFDYEEVNRYFVGTLIATKFAYEYKDCPIIGLKELKNFLCTAHLGSYESKLEMLQIEPSNMPYMDYQIQKSENLIFRKR